MDLKFKKIYLHTLFILLSFTYLNGGLFRHPLEKPLINDVISFTFTVDNMETSLEFYTKLLEFKKIADFTLSGKELSKLFNLPDAKVRVVRLQLGQETLELLEFIRPKGRKNHLNVNENSVALQHLAIVVSDMSAAYLFLLKKGVTSISVSPSRLPLNGSETGGAEVFYFKDPDGHLIQLISFPPGHGESRWQTDFGQLFLGIDHSAIKVKSTQKSLEFYHFLLGFNVSDTHFYHGWQEEKLSQIKNPKIQGTLLQSSFGPKLELLQYIEPISGKRVPTNTKPNDVWSTFTQLSTVDIEHTYLKMIEARVFLISSSPVSIPNSSYKKVFLCRDPDGYFVLISSPY